MPKRSTTLQLIAVLAAVVATATSVTSLMITLSARPPSAQPILQIIESEATAALERDIEKAISLYAEDAFVRDALGEAGKELGTVPLEVTTSWSGLEEIRERYANLPRFEALRHLGVVVTFDHAGKFAHATASTNGVIENETGVFTPIFSIDGERWNFEQIDGVWKITSFTYNVP